MSASPVPYRPHAELRLRASAVLARAPQDIPVARFDCQFCGVEDIPVLLLDANGACPTCNVSRRYRY